MDQANPVPPLQHIFVSYARADSEEVYAIVARLKSDGFNVWIDQDSIKVSEQWGTEIVEAVDKAYAFLLMLSPSAVASKYVHDEVYVAYTGPKDLVYVPVLLKPVEIAGDLRLPLARVQYIEYYRDPEATYAELVKALDSRKPKPTSPMRGVGLVLQGLNRFNFDAEKQKQLLDSLANFTRTPRAEFEITKPIDLSGHIVVKMPADAAYRLKTAALNSNDQLINYGIKGLRFTGDRSFVLVKSGRFAPLKSGNLGGGLTSGGWIAGGLALATVGIFLLYLLLRHDNSQVQFSVTAPQTMTNTPTITDTRTPTSSRTPTRTPTRTFTPTLAPSSTPATPEFVLDTQSNCRSGPSQAYSVITSFTAGETVKIIARSNTEFIWYYIEKTTSGIKFNCWISFDDNGQAFGNLTEVPVRNLPPPPPQSVRLESFGQPLYVGQTLEQHDFAVGCGDPSEPVSLNWDAPSDTSGIASYEIMLTVGSYEIMLADSGDVILKTTVSHPPPSIDITSYLDIYCGSIFEARVKAIDPEGASSAWSEPIYFEAD